MAAEDVGAGIRPLRVLSVQSHVVTGYVGLRAGTFPLQLLGVEVDALPTVLFSNHGAYPTVRGPRLGRDEVAALVAALDANGLLRGRRYSHILTGTYSCSLNPVIYA